MTGQALGAGTGPGGVVQGRPERGEGVASPLRVERRRRIGGDEGRSQIERQRINQLELRLLGIRDEAGQSHRLSDLRKRIQACGQRIGLLEARRQDIDHVRRGLGVGRKGVEDAHRLALWILEVQGVEVEGDGRHGKERGATGERRGRDHQSRALRPMGSDAPAPERAQLRPEHGQQRGQEGQADRPGDRHAGGRDDAELGEAPVVGGHE